MPSFAEAASDCNSNDENENDDPRLKDGGLFSFQMQAQSFLEEWLCGKWQGILCAVHGCHAFGSNTICRA
jgi:hypothetical protein